MEKKVNIKKLHDYKKSISDDLAYWLGKSPEERIAAVEMLRRQFHGKNLPRLQRTVRIINRVTGQVRRLTDLEALGED